MRKLPAPPPLRLSPQGFDLIAEVKRRSPSAGSPWLARPCASPSQARNYVRGGAAALSVLTEPEAFDGELVHLKEVAAAVRGAVHAQGLSGVALPGAGSASRRRQRRAADCGDAERRASCGTCSAMRTVWVCSRWSRSSTRPIWIAACRRIHAAGPAIVDGRCRTLLGVNCRDLRSLKVDFGRFAALAPRLPADIPASPRAASSPPARPARVAGLGYGLALVGTALMRAPDPAARVASLLAAGRASAFEARAPVRIFVKICGLSTPRAVSEAIHAGADAIGFVFAESPRQVTPKRAAQLCRDVSPVDHPCRRDAPPHAGRVARRWPTSLRRTGCRPRLAILHDSRSAERISRLPVFRDTPALDMTAFIARSWCCSRRRRAARACRPTGSGRPNCRRHGSRPATGAGRRTDARTMSATAIATVRPWGVDVSSGVESRRG